MNTIARLDDGLSTVGEIIEYPEELEGGRNLHAHSGSPYDGNYAYYPSKEIVDGIECLAWRSERDLIALNESDDISVGQEYMFSFWAKSSKEISLGRGVYINPSNSGFLNNETITTEWKRYFFSFDVKGRGDSVRVHMYPEISDSNGNVATFYLANWKLEKGSTISPWTPAPEDLGLSYPDWVQNFTTSFSENGVIAQEFIEGDNISIGKEVTTQHIKEGGL